MQPIQLPPLSLAIPAIKIAVEQGLLQAQKPEVTGPIGKYTGPCAVGILLPEDTRAALDNGVGGAYSIASLLNRGKVLPADDDSAEDWIDLQGAHDSWNGAAKAPHRSEATIEGRKKSFLIMLDSLAKKYPKFEA